jgi:single-strand DNA-binding protein
MNFITIAGQLGRDAEVRYLNSGDPVCSFSVADSAGRDKPTIWWNCSIFGKRAEALSQYLLKGQAVTVCGQVTEREWKDKDGNQRKSMDVRVSEISLQGGKKAAGGSQERSSGGGGGDDDIPFTPLAPGKSWAVV